jgi:hypothetical protein
MAPLMRKSTFIARTCGFCCALTRACSRARMQTHGDAAAMGAGMQSLVASSSPEAAVTARDRCRISSVPTSGTHLRPQRPIADAADAKRDLEAASLIIERDLGRGCDEREIRAPRTDFRKKPTPITGVAGPGTGSRGALASRLWSASVDEEIIRRHRCRAVRGRE